jgi:ankyrin repeat protein
VAQVSAALSALYRGDEAEGRDLLRAEPDIFEAAAFGATARVRELLAADPDAAHARAADDFTPLHLAAFFGHPAALRTLLAAGADPNAEASNAFLTRVRPLHSAAARSHHECCRILLAAGADVNAEQGGGFTALAAAEQNGDVELAAQLRALGAV